MLKSKLVSEGGRKNIMTADAGHAPVEQIGFVRRLTLNRPEQHNPLTPRAVRRSSRPLPRPRVTSTSAWWSSAARVVHSRLAMASSQKTSSRAISPLARGHRR